MAFRDRSGCQGVILMLFLLQITKIKIFRGIINLCQADLVFYQYLMTSHSWQCSLKVTKNRDFNNLGHADLGLLPIFNKCTLNIGTIAKFWVAFKHVSVCQRVTFYARYGEHYKKYIFLLLIKTCEVNLKFNNFQ